MISLGYVDSSERLAQEAGMTMDRYELCDNINLMQIITDFEAFQELKYGQKPKFTRPAANSQPPARQASNWLPPLAPLDGRAAKGAKSAKQMGPRAPPDDHPEPSPDEAPGSDRAPAPPSKRDVNLPEDVRLMKPIPVQFR
jgi:katanin p60 ATPase-containing subunit A1